MSLNTVCRVCLTMDVPMYSISESPLRDVYEKLTTISINTAHRPVVACYICRAQLRKCHNLMVRSLRSENVLRQLFLSENIVKGESFNILNREALRYTLSMTPIKIIAFTGIKEEPQLSLYNEGRGEDRPASAEYLKFWESDDEDHTETEWLVDIDDEDMKQEELDPLSMSTPVEYSKTKEVTIGGNIKSERAENVENVNSKGTVPAEKYEQTHEGNIRDGSTLTPGGKNILKKPRRPRPCEDDEATSKHLLINTKKAANNRQVSINTTMHSDTAINKSDVNGDSDNDYTDANIDVDNTGSKNLRGTFICNDCGNVFDDKYLLIEHIQHRQHHIAVKKTSCLESTILHKQNISITGVSNKDTEAHIREKVFECDICQRTFARKPVLKSHLFVHTGLKPFECEICKLKFGYKNTLNRHLRNHPKKKCYECEICKVQFSMKADLKKHSSVHREKKFYECEICKDKFSRKANLKKHSRVHTDSKYLKGTFICDDCGNVFDDKYLLIEHIEHYITNKNTIAINQPVGILRKQRLSKTSVMYKYTETESGIKFYECEACKNRFSDKTSLNTHLKVHTKEKLYDCEICKERFNRKYTLKMHLRVHAKEKPYECEICKVRYSQKVHLNIHLRVHTKEKPYECEICKVRFSIKGNLIRHIKTHTGEKPYKCEICERRFIQKSDLKAHYRIHTKKSRIHTRKKSYKCKICVMDFSDASSLRTHINSEKHFECEICKIKFSLLCNLKRHIKIHTGEKPYKCEICEKKFIQKVCLDAHFRTHTGETPYECEVCKKKFSDRSSFKVHSRIHTGEKRYECGICKVRFARSGSLKTHLKIHM